MSPSRHEIDFKMIFSGILARIHCCCAFLRSIWVSCVWSIWKLRESQKSALIFFVWFNRCFVDDFMSWWSVSVCRLARKYAPVSICVWKKNCIIYDRSLFTYFIFSFVLIHSEFLLLKLLYIHERERKKSHHHHLISCWTTEKLKNSVFFSMWTIQPTDRDHQRWRHCRGYFCEINGIHVSRWSLCDECNQKKKYKKEIRVIPCENLKN